MPKYTVKMFAQLQGKSEKTVRDWIHTDKLGKYGAEAIKDPGGRDWLIITDTAVEKIIKK